MTRGQFNDLLIDNAVGEHVRANRRLALTGVRRILAQLPENGNLLVFGSDRDEVKAELLTRIEMDGVGFGPMAMMILGALLNALITWWFTNRHEATAALASLKA